MCEYRGLGKCPVCSPKQKEDSGQRCKFHPDFFPDECCGKKQPIELPEEIESGEWPGNQDVLDNRNRINQIIKYLKASE